MGPPGIKTIIRTPPQAMPPGGSNLDVVEDGSGGGT
jgi:hypothetical protein